MSYQRPDFDPETEYIAWNGEIRKKGRPGSFNGDSEWEDQGFHSRGVHTTEGTNRPTNLKQVTRNNPLITGVVMPHPGSVGRREPEVNRIKKRK